MKLCYSADGDETHITADANGLEVQLGAALPAGTNNIGIVDVNSDVLHDAANTTETVQVGGHASPPETPPTAVSAAGDRVRAWRDLNGASIIRPRLMPTYNATYRLSSPAGAPQLGFTFTANTDKQLATIYHAASSTKTVRIRHISINLNNGNAGTITFEVRALSATTAPATGNPAITPRTNDSSDSAAEATCLALPTTAGSEAAANSPVSPMYNWQSAAFAATANPAGLNGAELVFYDHASQGFDTKPLTMRAGVAEGFAIIGRCSAAVGINYTAYIRFTEE